MNQQVLGRLSTTTATRSYLWRAVLPRSGAVFATSTTGKSPHAGLLLNSTRNCKNPPTMHKMPAMHFSSSPASPIPGRTQSDYDDEFLYKDYSSDKDEADTLEMGKEERFGKSHVPDKGPNREENKLFSKLKANEEDLISLYPDDDIVHESGNASEDMTFHATPPQDEADDLEIGKESFYAERSSENADGTSDSKQQIKEREKGRSDQDHNHDDLVNEHPKSPFSH